MPFRCFENSGNTRAATSNKFVGAKFIVPAAQNSNIITHKPTLKIAI